MALNFLKKIFGVKKTPEIPEELKEKMLSLRKEIFPNGDAQIVSETKELASILEVSPSRILETYTYACSRLFIGNCDKDTLKFGIARHDDGLSDNQIERFAKYVFKKYLKQKSKVTNDDFLEASLNAMGFINNDCGGQIYDEIPGGTGDFGTSITNPVPVNSIMSNEKYLSRLITDDGLKISWSRLGSGGAENIDKPIDIYVITDEKGSKRDTIYISPYHPHTSSKAPKGYKFK